MFSDNRKINFNLDPNPLVPELYLQLSMNTKKELTSTLIFLVTNVVIIMLCFFINFLIVNSSKVSYLFLKMILYFILCFMAFQINKKYKTKFLNAITNIILSPLYLFALFLAIGIPVISIQMSMYLYLAFSFILPMILFRIDENYHITILNFETWVYLITTFGVISAFIFHKQIRFVVYKILPFNAGKSEKLKGFNLVELNNYVLSENNVRFVIFSLYLVYLITINFWGLQGNSFYENPNVDKAVLQSFVTFVAFDRVLAAFKINEFRPSGLINNLKNSIGHVFK